MNPILQALMERAGVHFMGQPSLDFQAANVAHNLNVAMDAQPALITTSNAGIPAFLSTYVDPKLIEILVSPMKAAEVVGEWRLTGCTLVVTLEPCTMCAGAIVASRVGRLVFGAFDEKAGAVASLWDVVRDPRLNHRPEVTGGVLEAECAAVLDAFFSQRRGGGDG